MGCCREEENKKNCECPSDQVIKGLKAKLIYESCELNCTPADKCACEIVLSDIDAANQWIQSLPGKESSCDG